MVRLRKNEAIRELSCELGLISESIGSCRLQQGNTSVIVSVYGPVYGQNRNTYVNNDDSKTFLGIIIMI
jgi:ribonuclease PH